MALEKISLQGARTHNLKNVSLHIPREKLVVITGLSGSGKSSLAFDTIYAEGQRRYVESLSAYARQFLSMMDKPDIDHIEGLSPAISIDQKSVSHNPRSTVGTVTEIHDYLRLLFARTGNPCCPDHGVTLKAQTISQMIRQINDLPAGERFMILAPIVRSRKGEHTALLDGLLAQGFIRALIDDQEVMLESPPTIDPKRKHDIYVVVDRFKVRQDIDSRLSASLETALRLGGDIAHVRSMDNDQELIFSARYACPLCGYSLAELEPRLFSFNSPHGACEECDGLGKVAFFDPVLVVLDDRMSLADGALPWWNARYKFYYSMLKSLAAHYGFDVHTPWRALKPAHKDVILHGSGQEAIAFSHDDYVRNRPFEGVIPSFERRYRETTNRQVREELGRYRVIDVCSKCQGTRLNKAARHVFFENHNLPAITALPIEKCHAFFSSLQLSGMTLQVAEKIIKEIMNRLRFLVDVGLGYLSLARSADTLSGGESQRIRLASQIGAGLVGVMYVLDEPSIGLHQRDNQKLLQTLKRLRDIGNTVIVIEHDRETIQAADWLVDVGPMAGDHGGEIVYLGSPEKIKNCAASITGQFLAGKRSIQVPASRRPFNPEEVITICGANGNNLNNIDVQFPIGLFSCVTGVSGSGKSTLVNQTLYPIAARELNRSQVQSHLCSSISGLEQLDKVIRIDQSPIGRTPRSNPATYVGLFTLVRELFSGTREARARGYGPGRFSFNVRGGRCEACQGDGVVRVEMHFLPDVYVVCDECGGKRYNQQTLEVLYNQKSIAEVLNMTIADALNFFTAIPAVKRKLQMLVDVGLSYLRLGQSATTLSGGEAQRVKLAKELSRRDTSKTLYILDEPTTGLHFHDIELLIKILQCLCTRGNTIIVIEHNLDVIKTADWVIDLGPEGGAGGGRIVAQGSPEELADTSVSHTGKFLSGTLREDRMLQENEELADTSVSHTGKFLSGTLREDRMLQENKEGA